MGSPQVDLTALNAVQSLFVEGKRDPWYASVAADFVDLVIWNDQLRFPVLLLGQARDRGDAIVVPTLVDDLVRHETGVIRSDIRVVDEPRELHREHLAPAFRSFAAFAMSNSQRIRAFLELHASGWIKDQIRSRFDSDSQYIFDVHMLSGLAERGELARRVGVPESQIDYLFDLVLKYLLYAESAEGGYYLSHPIRSLQNFSYLGEAIDHAAAAAPQVPVRLGPHLVAAASNGQDWFTSSLHEARAFVREYSMINLGPQAVIEPETLRLLAARIGLPPRIRQYTAIENTASIAGAVGGFAGAVTASAAWPALVGSALTLTRFIWNGNMPRRLGRVSWLQWMLEWPLEKEN